MFPSLPHFISALERAGELRRVRARVSPVLEVAAIADRLSRRAAPGLPSIGSRLTDPAHHSLGGPAVLFESVEGSDFPVLINSLGSYRRMEMALGCHEGGRVAGGLEGLAGKIGGLVRPEFPRSLGELVRKGRELLPLLAIPPRRRSVRGPCQEVLKTGDQIDLTRLPMIRCWPLDGDFEAVGYPAGVNDGVPGLETGEDWDRRFRGRYITLGGIHTVHAADAHEQRPASHNIGMYRVQLLGRRTMAMHWHMHHDGARHWRSWKAVGKPMPVAVALGGESVLPYAATAPLPPGISELLLAGFLQGRGIEMVRGVTVPLWVPANAEIIIEGFVSHESGGVGWEPGAEPLGPGAVFEGPFGDHTGFYSLPDRYPLLTVTAVTHRRHAVYPTTVVGLPPQEDYFMGKATERIFLPLLRTIVPDIEDYDLPMYGAFHNCAAVRVRKSYPMHARRVMHSVWGAGQMAWTKCVVVVDDDVAVHDGCAVLRAVGEHCVPGRDVELVHGPLDILDHAAPFLGSGAKFGLDATRKWPGAETHRALSGLAAELCGAGDVPAVVASSASDAAGRVRRIGGVAEAMVPAELGGWWMLVWCVPGADSGSIIKAIGAAANEVVIPRWTVLVTAGNEPATVPSALFHWLANICPERDRYLSVCGRRVAFDATAKVKGVGRMGLPVRAFPPVLRVSEDVRAGVERRWSEYGLD
ncbi:MAG: UbiD family decarboxylase [Phycisphaerales bacterium]